MSELDTLHASTSASTADLATEISRKFLDLDRLTAEREAIQLQIKETRNHASTLEAREALLVEHHTYILAEQEFIGAECERTRASFVNEDDPPGPHVKAAQKEFLSDLRTDIDRIGEELHELHELAQRLREEKEVLKGTFEEQALAFLGSTGHWVDTLKEVVQTVQSIKEDERVAIRNTLAETKGEDVAKQFWEFCTANPRKDDGSIQA